MNICAVRLKDSFDSPVFKQVRQNIPPEKNVRLDRFARKEDAERALLSEVLPRVLLSQAFGIRNRDIFFCKNEFGKPYVRNRSDAYFNVSHSGDWVVCALARNEIGIDIEKIKQINSQIADCFFSKEELVSLNHIEGNDRLNRFYEIWTLKESYVKAVGEGLSMPLNSFTVRTGNRVVSVKSEKNFGQFYFKIFEIDEGYKMAACSRNNDFPHNVDIKDIAGVYEEFLLLR